MAQRGFKHIAVTAAEDDDVVVVAGIGASEQRRELEQQKKEPEPKPEPVAPAPSDSAPERIVAQTERVRPVSKRSRDMGQQTLDDLKSDPMPTAQKVVIIAAVVCIIGALVYYFVFMG